MSPALNSSAPRQSFSLGTVPFVTRARVFIRLQVQKDKYKKAILCLSITHFKSHSGICCLLFESQERFSSRQMEKYHSLCLD